MLPPRCILWTRRTGAARRPLRRLAGSARLGLILAALVLFVMGLGAGLALTRPELLRGAWAEWNRTAPLRGVERQPIVDQPARDDSWAQVRIGSAAASPALAIDSHSPGGRNGQRPSERGSESEAATDDGAGLQDFELVVQSGMTLGRIAEQRYGRRDVALVEALARYNQLEHANMLESGQVLRLPDLETLERQVRAEAERAPN